MPTQRKLLQNFNQVSNSANKKKNESKKIRKRLQFHSNSNSNSPMKTISIRKVLNDILNEQEKSKMIDELLKLGNRLKALKPKNDGTVSNNQKRVITKMKNLLIKNNNKK